jgi:pimeloyl-ACP methyl ester carboxylesterase
MKKFALIAGVLLLAAACVSVGHVGEIKAPTPWSHWTEIDGASVHYLDTAPGSDLPVLLVLPGFLGSTATFVPITEALSRDLRVVIPDLPGFGWSEAPPGGCATDDRIAFVRAFADRLDLGPVHLAGSSLGANIAIRFAVANPDHVKSLVLLSPFGLQEQREAVSRLERLDPLLPLVTHFVSRHALKRELEKQVRDPAELTKDILESFRRPFRSAAGRRVVVEVSRHILYGSFFDEYLPLVPQPTLVLTGSEDAYRSQDTLGVLESRIPSCITMRLEGCRHLIHLDAPAEVAELIAWFCSAVGS